MVFFYAARTESDGNWGPQSVYTNFLRIARAWRLFKILQRAGKLHANGLQAGELVVRCPACPRPGFNLPKGWASDPKR